MNLVSVIRQQAQGYGIHIKEKKAHDVPSKLPKKIYKKDEKGDLLASLVQKVISNPEWKDDKTVRAFIFKSVKTLGKKKKSLSSQACSIFESSTQSVGAYKQHKAQEKETRKHLEGLSEKKKLGLSPQEIKSLVRFIDKKGISEKRSGSMYWKKNEFRIPRTVEKTESGLVLIHLKKHGGLKELGRGAFKVATLSILYEGKQSKLVANCTMSEKCRHEIPLFEKVQGLKNVASLTTHSQHVKRKTQETRLSLILPLYDKGSLKSYCEKDQGSFYEKTLIAADILRGMKSLHDKGLLHRDTHLGNILLRSTSNKNIPIEAAITDFGGIIEKEKIIHNGGNIQAAGWLVAPECLDKKMEDPMKAEAYAIGYNLARLFLPKKSDLHNTVRSLEHISGEYFREKTGERLQSLKNTISDIHKELLKLGADTKFHKDRSEVFLGIAKLFDPNPKTRITTQEGYDLFKGIVKKSLAEIKK